MQSTELAYRNLADAIILQAVTDYRNALNGQSYNYKSPETIIKEIERFFLSDYFDTLTKVKGEHLIYKLRQEHIENKRNMNSSEV